MTPIKKLKGPTKGENISMKVVVAKINELIERENARTHPFVAPGPDSKESERG